MMFKNLILKISLTFLASGVYCISVAQADYIAASRFDYYTDEDHCEVAVWIPTGKAGTSTTLDIVFEYKHLLRGAEAIAGQYNLYSFPADSFHTGYNELTVSFYENGKWVYSEKVDVVFREDRYNAVKIDRLSGGLIVEGLPFYPFGFYTYFPVQPGLAEEEVVKGFNMMSPYQKIEGKTLKDRKAYMDRCAALGMKVNYNLLSLAGGGGVGSGHFEKFSRKKQEMTLRKEIETFRDHPALLSWYISDEPVGQGVPPDSLEFAYSLIKELDPYHPVTMVFMAPLLADEYSHVMDIVMADPYVIPNGKVAEVGDVAAMLYHTFFLRKPVWIVPQAFGGNEWWEREPTRQELRVMTYLALVNHATGIQYFIRLGLNSFPKSTTAWAECGSMALEFAEITPYLFSPDPVPDIKASDESIQMRGFHLNNSFLIVAVNAENKPKQFEFSIKGLRYNGSVDILFEDRQVQIIEGKAEDIIDAYGTRVYRVTYKMLMSNGPRIHPKNILLDPSFEDITSLGVPASCYAHPMGDRGATYFTDSRIAARSGHSLRMTAPDYDGGTRLSFQRTRIEPGQSYTLSVQAMALPLKYRAVVKKGFFGRLCGCGENEDDYPMFSMSLGGEDCKEKFVTDGEWHEYSFSCMPVSAEGEDLVNPTLTMLGKGTAWFDLLQMYADMEIRSFVNRDNNNIMVRLTTVHSGAEIRYTLDGSEPGRSSTLFKGNFSIQKSANVRAAAFLGDRQVGSLNRYMVVDLATGRYVEYRHKYSPKYNAGYDDGLVDGILAGDDFKDGKWQGFEGDDLDITLHLSDVLPVSRLTLRFLVDQASWIFMPEFVKVSWSANGVDYSPLEELSFAIDENIEPGIRELVLDAGGIKAKYFRITAKNIGVCPEGHPGAGGKTWLFTDEIIIE